MATSYCRKCGFKLEFNGVRVVDEEGGAKQHTLSGLCPVSSCEWAGLFQVGKEAPEKIDTSE